MGVKSLEVWKGALLFFLATLLLGNLFTGLLSVFITLFTSLPLTNFSEQIFFHSDHTLGSVLYVFVVVLSYTVSALIATKFLKNRYLFNDNSKVIFGGMIYHFFIFLLLNPTLPVALSYAAGLLGMQLVGNKVLVGKWYVKVSL